MALTIPAHRAQPQFIPRGQAEVFTGAYVANGADASNLFWLGGRTAKTTLAISRKYGEVELQDYLNHSDAFVIGEEVKITTTYAQLTLERIRELFQALGLTLTGGTDAAVAGSLPFGEDLSMNMRQLVIRTSAPPAGGSSMRRILQFWKVFPQAQGSIDFAKEGVQQLQITFKALTDESAIGAGAAAVFKMFDQ